jgi:putative ABC transport system substrate-binding protein
MHAKTWSRFPYFRTDNLNPEVSNVEPSKTYPELRRRIRNAKWAGLFAIVIALTICGARAQAQHAGKVFRIGFLDPSTAAGMAVLVDAFRQELNKLGWTEGKNISIEYRFAEQKLDQVPNLAADLVRQQVDLIVVSGTPAAIAAKKLTTVIPIVIAAAGDPVAAKLVSSLARPGGNVTGLSALAVELNTKRLEILNETVRNVSRVGLLHPPGASLGRELQLKDLRRAAAALKINLAEIETRLDAKGIERAFQTAQQKNVNAIMPTNATSWFTERERLIELTRKYRFPAIYFQSEFVTDGGLMSYGVDYEDLYRRMAGYVNKILKGAKPADLPVQQATKFEFIINLKTAKQIGITIPGRVLERADRVIK